MEVFDDYLESLQKLSYLIDSEYMSNYIISLSSMYKVRVYIGMKKNLDQRPFTSDIIIHRFELIHIPIL